MNLSELWEVVKDREAQHATVHEVARVRRDLTTKQQQQHSIAYMYMRIYLCISLLMDM